MKPLVSLKHAGPGASRMPSCNRGQLNISACLQGKPVSRRQEAMLLAKAQKAAHLAAKETSSDTSAQVHTVLVSACFRIHSCSHVPANALHVLSADRAGLSLLAWLAAGN